MQRPIIGSVSGEPAEILERSSGALVVRPEDSRAIADKVLFLRQHPKIGEKMGQDGRKFVEAHYSRGSLAGQYLDILREAVWFAF